MERSGVLQVLSMATDWDYPESSKNQSAELTWCHWHGVSRMALFLRQKMSAIYLLSAVLGKEKEAAKTDN